MAARVRPLYRVPGDSGERVDTTYKLWHDLISDIKALCPDSFEAAGRLRAMRMT
ncbi:MULTISPECIES: hypothetical protein [Streptomyces]|uniref:Uncharacterized protein n=1 Tax=Streptomyces typhae TaxID=2681492 RepID=A0A6L6WWJ0_9ACTN|nr:MULTISPECIES: hypothetical protein [Streptomyces]MVO84541.1 hypothetical protein [Streptomyces typhae]